MQESITGKLLDLGITGIALLVLGYVAFFLYKQLEKANQATLAEKDSSRTEILKRLDSFIEKISQLNHGFMEMCQTCNTAHSLAIEKLDERHRDEIKNFYDKASNEYREFTGQVQQAIEDSATSINGVAITLKELCVLLGKRGE